MFGSQVGRDDLHPPSKMLMWTDLNQNLTFQFQYSSYELKGLNKYLIQQNFDPSLTLYLMRLGLHNISKNAVIYSDFQFQIMPLTTTVLVQTTRQLKRLCKIMRERSHIFLICPRSTVLTLIFTSFCCFLKQIKSRKE